MGRPKTQLLVGGELMLHRQLRLLREAGASELIVSGNPQRPEVLSPPEQDDCLAVWDQSPEAGPLAGLERILGVTQEDRVLVIAVDLPALKVGFLQDLISRSNSETGVVPEIEGRLEPLAAVYPRNAHGRIVAQLASGQRAVRDVVLEGIRDAWMRPWSLSSRDAACLVNWNRPGDWPETTA